MLWGILLGLWIGYTLGVLTRTLDDLKEVEASMDADAAEWRERNANRSSD